MNVLFYLVVRHWNGELKRKIQGKKPRLYVVILKCFWWRILVLGVTMLAQVSVHCATCNVLKIELCRYIVYACQLGFHITFFVERRGGGVKTLGA